jgi:hypothetical protein
VLFFSCIGGRLILMSDGLSLGHHSTFDLDSLRPLTSWGRLWVYSLNEPHLVRIGMWNPNFTPEANHVYVFRNDRRRLF